MSMRNKDPGVRPVRNTSEEIPRTKQEFEAETNIRNIMAKYRKTGELSHVRESLGQYRDMREVPDLHTALSIAADAHSAFEELPSAIRSACDHDVGKFLDFVEDPDNRELCEQEGLFEKKTPKAKAESKSVPTPKKEEKKTETAGEKPVKVEPPKPDAS